MASALDPPARRGRPGRRRPLGPHLLDLLDAAVGPVKAIRGTGDSRAWLELAREHENGAVSQASLSGAVNAPRAVTRVELFGAGEPSVYDTAEIDHAECWPVLRREFATAVRTGVTTAPDAARGLYLQELIARVGWRHVTRVHDEGARPPCGRAPCRVPPSAQDAARLGRRQLGRGKWQV